MKNGFYLATGFNGWGISNGTAAGMLIADCVQGLPNSWAKLYDDARPYPDDFNPGGDTQSLIASIASIAMAASRQRPRSAWETAPAPPRCSIR